MAMAHAFMAAMERLPAGTRAPPPAAPAPGPAAAAMARPPRLRQHVAAGVRVPSGPTLALIQALPALRKALRVAPVGAAAAAPAEPASAAAAAAAASAPAAMAGAQLARARRRAAGIRAGDGDGR